jgi:hypothetical protein
LLEPTLAVKKSRFARAATTVKKNLGSGWQKLFADIKNRRPPNK